MVLPNKFLSYLHLNSKLCDLGLKNKPKFLDAKAEALYIRSKRMDY